MGQLSVSIRHRFDHATATRKIKELIPRLKRQHDDQITDAWEEWQGSSAEFGFRTSGHDIMGTLTVTDSHVIITGKLPFLVSFFSDQIEDAIRSEAAKLLI